MSNLQSTIVKYPFMKYIMIITKFQKQGKYKMAILMIILKNSSEIFSTIKNLDILEKHFSLSLVEQFDQNLLQN